jgi:hypothetical protein
MKHYLLLTVLVFSGCASVRSGNHAVPTKDSQSSRYEGTTKLGVVITGQEDMMLSSGHFAIVNFTFQNRSRKWVGIRNVQLDFEDPILNAEVVFPVGAQAAAWGKAMQEVAAVDAANTAAVLGTIMALGGVAGAASDSRNVRTAGALSFATSATMLTAAAAMTEVNRSKLAAAVPDSHLLSEAFEIPPGLHVKKWILLYTENPYSIPYAETVLIKYDTVNGRSEAARLAFRQSRDASKWQVGHSRVFKGERGEQLKTASN